MDVRLQFITQVWQTFEGIKYSFKKKYDTSDQLTIQSIVF